MPAPGTRGAIRPLVLPELARPAAQPQEPEPVETQLEPEGLTVVREAHRMGRAIIARAKTHAKELETEAWEQGFKTGREQALQSEAETLRQAAHALSTAAARLAALANEGERDLTQALPRFAFRLAQAVLQTEITLNPDALTAVVRTGIRAVLPARQIVLTLHPEDRAALDRARATLGELLEGTELRLQTRDDVERGHATVETEALVLDTSVERRLEEAMRLIRECQ